jgi:hypothetical protein
MKTLVSSEMLVPIYENTQLHNQGENKIFVIWYLTEYKKVICWRVLV